MIVMNLNLKNVFGFTAFDMNFAYPKKIANSIIENEHLAERPNFRYKKAVILMGANATGKTILGKVLMRIFKFISSGNTSLLLEMMSPNTVGSFVIDFVNDGFILHRLSAIIDTENDTVTLKHSYTEIEEKDSYKKCTKRLCDEGTVISAEPKVLKKLFGELKYYFPYPQIESTSNTKEMKKDILLQTLRAVIGTLDPSLKDVTVATDLRESFIIRRKGTEIIIQNGTLLNREILSGGTIQGIDISIFLAAMFSGAAGFYYCDECFSHIQTDIEKRIFGIMLNTLKDNEQLIFTTNNTDMLDINLPKHSYAFLRKTESEDGFPVSVVYASDILERKTESVRCAVENQCFFLPARRFTAR